MDGDGTGTPARAPAGRGACPVGARPLLVLYLYKETPITKDPLKRSQQRPAWRLTSHEGCWGPGVTTEPKLGGILGRGGHSLEVAASSPASCSQLCPVGPRPVTAGRGHRGGVLDTATLLGAGARRPSPLGAAVGLKQINGWHRAVPRPFGAAERQGYPALKVGTWGAHQCCWHSDVPRPRKRGGAAQSVPKSRWPQGPGKVWVGKLLLAGVQEAGGTSQGWGHLCLPTLLSPAPVLFITVPGCVTNPETPPVRCQGHR